MNTNIFMSDNGFPPKRWGPLLWKTIHILGANFPLQPTMHQSRAYYQFFNSLCTVLPCKHCRKEFCALVRSRDSPLRLQKTLFFQAPNERAGTARKRVFRWTVLIHANVNKRLGRRYSSHIDTWALHYAKLRKPVH